MGWTYDFSEQCSRTCGGQKADDLAAFFNKTTDDRYDICVIVNKYMFLLYVLMCG